MSLYLQFLAALISYDFLRAVYRAVAKEFVRPVDAAKPTQYRPRFIETR